MLERPAAPPSLGSSPPRGGIDLIFAFMQTREEVPNLAALLGRLFLFQSS